MVFSYERQVLGSRTGRMVCSSHQVRYSPTVWLWGVGPRLSGPPLAARRLPARGSLDVTAALVAFAVVADRDGRSPATVSALVDGPFAVASVPGAHGQVRKLTSIVFCPPENQTGLYTSE